MLQELTIWRLIAASLKFPVALKTLLTNQHNKNTLSFVQFLLEIVLA